MLHCGTGEAVGVADATVVDVAVAVVVAVDVAVLVAVAVAVALVVDVAVAVAVDVPPTLKDNRQEAEDATGSIVVQLDKVESVQI